MNLAYAKSRVRASLWLQLMLVVAGHAGPLFVMQARRLAVPLTQGPTNKWAQQVVKNRPQHSRRFLPFAPFES